MHRHENQNTLHENDENQRIQSEFQTVTCMMVVHNNVSFLLKYYRSFQLNAYLGPIFIL